MWLPQLKIFLFMNLDTVLDITERNTQLIMMWVEGRRIDPQYDTRYFMEQVNLSPVISELSQIELGMMAYGGNLYRELAERLDEKNGIKIDREVISIINRLEEYSFAMFPDTRYNRYIDDDLTNEDCAKYLIKCATEEDRVNAKNAMLQQWREDCDARSSNFIKHIGSLIDEDEDIVIKATTTLHNIVMQFAIMLDCVLLENHHDLIKMQEQYGLKILKDHSKILLTEYTHTKNHAERLLNGIGNVEVKDGTTSQSQRGQPKGKAVEPFIQNIFGDIQEKERILNILHRLIDGKRGKGVAMVIHAACTAKIIQQPTFKQVENEFGDIGNVSGYNRYMRDTHVYTERELEAIRSQF